VLAGSGRCGSTLLQSILNTNPDFLIWGEHNGFLEQIAAAYYGADHPLFPDRHNYDSAERIKRLRDARRWAAWDNPCGKDQFLDRFRTFIRSYFADPTGRATRWGFKEIRYGRNVQDQTLRLMFDCFAATRLIIVIREPEPTIVSMLSRWAFSDNRSANIHVDEVDLRILAAADAWNVQYLQLESLRQMHPSNCLALRYEDLASSETYRELSAFLETSPFDYQSRIRKVKDASNKTDATAVLIRQRIEFLQPQIATATSAARAAYGYSTLNRSGRRRITA